MILDEVKPHALFKILRRYELINKECPMWVRSDVVGMIREFVQLGLDAEEIADVIEGCDPSFEDK